MAVKKKAARGGLGKGLDLLIHRSTVKKSMNWLNRSSSTASSSRSLSARKMIIIRSLQASADGERQKKQA